MADLASQVPRERESIEALKTLALAGLQLVPLGGGAIAQVVGDVLARQSRRRDLEFFRLLASQLQALIEKVEGLTLEGAFDDDQFVAHSHRLLRAAQETACEEKRYMLAAALASSGSWSPLPEREIERFVDIVARYTPLHILMVKFFQDPAVWLRVHSDTWNQQDHDRDFPDSWNVDSVLRDHVFRGDEVFPDEVNRVGYELKADDLVNFHGLGLLVQGMEHPLITPLGIKFLKFLGADE